jgi:K+-sensing histidine kinase KdpD
VETMQPDQILIRAAPAWRAYSVAVLSVIVAALVRALFDPVLGDSAPSVTFFIAVVVTSWYGGWGPAILATVLSLTAANYFFVSPRYEFQFDFQDARENVRFFSFLIISLCITGFIEALRRSVRSGADRAQRLAEQRKLREVTLASIGDAVITTDRQGLVNFLTRWPKR